MTAPHAAPPPCLRHLAHAAHHLRLAFKLAEREARGMEAESLRGATVRSVAAASRGALLHLAPFLDGPAPERIHTVANSMP